MPNEIGEKRERDEKGRYLEGHESHGGRPKGSFSIKTRIIQRLKENPEEFEELVENIIKNQQALLFQMIDGRPSQDLKLDGEIRLPRPILDVSANNSDEKDKSSEEEDQGSSGGNVSE